MNFLKTLTNSFLCPKPYQNINHFISWSAYSWFYLEDKGLVQRLPWVCFFTLEGRGKSFKWLFRLEDLLAQCHTLQLPTELLLLGLQNKTIQLFGDSAFLWLHKQSLTEYRDWIQGEQSSTDEGLPTASFVVLNQWNQYCQIRSRVLLLRQGGTTASLLLERSESMYFNNRVNYL